jgi:CRISPR-associated exonuclease Cas4
VRAGIVSRGDDKSCCAVRCGALFYVQTRRRVEIQFDTELRELTEDTTSSLRNIFETGKTPPAVYRSNRCRNCSLIDLCRPKASGKSALAFRDRMVHVSLNGGPTDGYDSDAI